MSYPEPPDPDPRGDEPECICGDPLETPIDPHPDCHYHDAQALVNGSPNLSFIQRLVEAEVDAEICGVMLMVHMPAGYDKPMSRCRNRKPCAEHPGGG